MKKRGVYSDGVMKFLMHGYERPSLGGTGMAGLVERLEERAAELGSARGQRPTRARTLRIRSVMVRVSAMAAAVLVFVALGLFAFSAATVGTPWRIDAASGRMTAGMAVVKADGGAQRVLSSANERIIMEAGAVLEVSGTFMHALTRDGSNVYTLRMGSVLVDHSRGSFRLVTPWASIVPIGTVVRASVSGETVRVACDGGAIELRPLDGSQAYILRAGDAMAATQVGGKWAVSTDNDYAAIGSSTIASVESASPASSVSSTSSSGESAQSEPLGEATSAIALARPGSSEAGDKATAGRFAMLWSADTGTQAAAVARIALGSEAVYLYRAAADGDSILKVSDKDGRVIGATKLGASYEKHAFDGDRVYLVSGASLSAVDIGSGALLWRAAVGPMGFAELTVDTGRVYLASADGTLYVVDAATGTSLGTRAVGSGLYGKPLVAGGRVVFSSISKELRSIDGTSLADVWKVVVPGGLLGDAPVMIGALVVTEDASGNLLAFGRDDGRLAWSIPTGQAGTAAAFGIAGGALFMRDGKPTVAAADGSTVTIVGMAGDLLAADRYGAVITSGGLYRLAPRGPATSAGIVAGTSIRAIRGAIDGGRIIVLTADGRLEKWLWVDGR